MCDVLSPPPPSLSSPPLRAYLLDGNFFIASALGSMLTKLCARYLQLAPDPQSQNVSGTPLNHTTSGLFKSVSCHWQLQAFCAEAMLMIASVLHLGKSGIPKKVGSLATHPY